MWFMLLPAAGAFLAYKIYESVKGTGKTITLKSFNTPAAKNVGQVGKAKPAALAVYQYIKQTGLDGSPALKSYINVFQQMHNSDSMAVAVTGPLPVNSMLDLPTSSALTLYTGDPIPPDPLSPTIAAKNVDQSPATIAGPATMSAHNLYTYLKKYKNDRSASLHLLVQQFQHDVNTDPKFPGPAAHSGSVNIVGKPLVEDGLYGPLTGNALTLATHDPIAP